MDEKKLIEFIDKHYEWTYPYVSGDEAKFERLKPCKKSVEYKTLEQNPQLGPRIIEIKPDVGLKPCDWCGQIVNQRCNHTLKFMSIDGKRAKRRWEHSCQNCRRALDPKTGKAKEPRARKTPEQLKEEQAAKIKELWWNKDNK